MPTYDMKNTKTGEVKEMFLKIAEKEELVAAGEWEQVHFGSYSIVSHTGSIINKTSGDWKDLLKAVKKGSGRNNTIKT